MKKRLKLINPRVPNTDSCSEEQRQSNADAKFVEQFSRKQFLDRHHRLLRIIQERGWVPNEQGSLCRDGIILDSIEGFETDRIAATACDAQQSDFALETHVRTFRNSPAMIRALREAWEAGVLWCELTAYIGQAEGRGRPKMAATIFAALDKAAANWRLKNPRISRCPRAKELITHYIGPNLGGDKNFANWVSRWRPKKSAK